MSYIRKRYGKAKASRRRATAMGGVAGAIHTLAAITGIAADVTYLRGTRAPRKEDPAPLGDIGTTLTNLASTWGIATDLANDPYLAETVCRVGQLKAMTNGQPVKACTKTASGLRGGVGLSRVMPAMRAYVYAEQHPWAYIAAFAGIIGVPLAIGYALGRR